MVNIKNTNIRNYVEWSISDLKSASNTIEDQLAPSAGNAFVGFSGIIPGAGTAIFSKFVNNIRPLSSKLRSCVDRLEGLSREVEELENNLEYWKNKYNDLRED